MNNFAFHYSPRCGAKTKRNSGAPCRSPAVKGKKRCRMHGGAKGSGGQLNNTNALKHGLSCRPIKELKKRIRKALAEFHD